nr:hypothetical protein [Prevotella sp.]
MKKKYIQPNVSVSFVVVESQLLDGSGGIYTDQNDDGGSCSKKHDFTDDSFDNTAWPKGKSPWED